MSLVDKFLTNGSEMVYSLILTFSKEGIENVLLSVSSFFDAFVFSYCCCAPFKDKHSCEAKGYLSLTNDKHLHEHFVMIRTIPLIKLLFIYIICIVSLSRPLKHLGMIPLSSSTPPFQKHSNVSHTSI